MANSDNPPHKHHYVPAFYLAPWAGADRKLTVFRRPRKNKITAHRRHPNEVGYQGSLYTAGAENYETRFFKDFDLVSSISWRKALLATETTAFSREDRKALSEFLFTLSVRSPGHIASRTRAIGEKISQGIPELEAWFREARRNVIQEGAPLPASFAEYAMQEFDAVDHKDVALGSIAMLPQEDKISALASSLSFRIFCLRDNEELITSDRPVVMIAPIDDGGFIGAPISPKKFLLGYRHPKTLAAIRRKGSAALFNFSNLTTAQNAETFVFSTGEAQASFVEKHFIPRDVLP